jgi:hypothetical protein
LQAAIERAERGTIDADLGGGLIKQRLARPGQGRSGGYRVIVAYRVKGRAVFLFGFAKNDLDTISPDQLQTFRTIGANCWPPAPRRSDRPLTRASYRRSTMTNKPSRMDQELLEMAEAQRRLGIMDEPTFRKITVRHLGPDALPTAEPISGEEIRSVREQAHLSQAALAGGEAGRPEFAALRREG